MNTLDLYIDHLKAEQKNANDSGLIQWILTSTNELNRALGFAQEHELTDRHRSLEQNIARNKRAAEIAKELWIQQNSDNQEWAEMAWAEMTMPDDWHPDALQLLEESYRMMAEEKH